MKENFDLAFEKVIGVEGGFQKDRRDRGNWTSGLIGKGQLKGTKFGISAMAYPDLDIENLTLEQAKDIYYRDYWTPVNGDALPVGVDYITFDTAVNHGTKPAAVLLQKAVGAVPDGAIGPRSLKRIVAKAPEDIIVEFAVRRALAYAGMKMLNTYGLGWYRRLFKVTLAALDQSKGE
ncbi:MAG: secretion activator protein [Gammaproteobacteria bacterium]|nr:secretion activator protein [Gammaproteobacteria bacterium]